MPLPQDAIGAVTRILARYDRMTDLLPLLHQHATTAGGADTSVVLEFDGRTGELRSTSAFGLDHLAPDSWLVTAGERAAAERALGPTKPTIIEDLARDLPGLAARLEARAALLVPLVYVSERRGLLLLGYREGSPPPSVLSAIDGVAEAFVLALERARSQQVAELQREVRGLFLGFAQSAAAPYSRSLGFDRLCQEANRLFAADRSTLWTHDRRTRELVLAAASDGSHLARPDRVSTEDALSPAAATLRRDHAELADLVEDRPGHSTRVVATVPLKGQRRALGALLLEGIRIDPGLEGEVLDHLNELGRQLSSALENAQLLDEVLRSRRELEDTFNSMHDLVIVCDNEMRVVRVNDALANRVNLTKKQIVDRPLSDFVAPDLLTWLQGLDLTSAEAWKTYTGDVDDRILGGTFSITVTPLVGPTAELHGSVLVARDVTREKRIEIERAAWRDRLAQSETLAALGQLVAGIAHELNNPLQAVLGNLELLRASGRMEGSRRELQTIYKEADRAAKIVRNLLVFAGSRRLTHRSTSVNAILGRTFALRTTALRAARIQLRRTLADKLPRVSGDPLLLQQAFLNIIINAEQAVSGRPDQQRIEVRSSYLPTLNLVRIDFHDTGPGIPEGVLPRIFDPFFTTKEVGIGTGLGLAITFRIIEAHGGTIVAANDPEGGAIFTVQLPASGNGKVSRIDRPA